ncbi:MAG: hypothetical protein ACFFD6_03330 [Candidatus Thorarchaeota archaeon]
MSTAVSNQMTLVRFIGITLAATLLNVGLYIVMYISAPLFAGFVCGFFLLNSKWGAAGGFLGAFLAYLPFLMILESIASTGADFLSILLAVLLLSLIGLIGGALGGIAGIRYKQSAQA